MKSYLKIIFSVIFTVVFIAISVQVVTAQTDPAQSNPQDIQAQASPQPTPAQPDPLQAASTQVTPPQDASGPNSPVQTDTLQTDHAQKPAKPLTYYNYAHDEAEYSVSLPEAPTVSTIWQESPTDTKPFLKLVPSDHASLGEIASFKLVDIDTEEVFDVKITFLRATTSFLEGLTDEKIHHMLTKKFSEVSLSNETFNISDGASTLKWATLSGFVLDNHHHPAFYALHYLTGLQSILVVQAKYSIENKSFQEYYNHLVTSITYVQP